MKILLVLVLCIVASSNAGGGNWHAALCHDKHCKCDEACVAYYHACTYYGYYLKGYCVKTDYNPCHCGLCNLQNGFHCAVYQDGGKYYHKCIDKPRIDPCSKNPCKHGGTCTSTPDSCEKCDCTPCYTGDYCETPIKDCTDTNPCEHGGTCTVVEKDGQCAFECECTPCYKGEYCQTAVKICTSETCKNKGQCRREEVGDQCLLLCTCTPCYKGKDCSEPLEICDDNPCKNGGTCKLVEEGSECKRKCDCPLFYTGDFCQNDPCTNIKCGPCAECKFDLSRGVVVSVKVWCHYRVRFCSTPSSPLPPIAETDLEETEGKPGYLPAPKIIKQKEGRVQRVEINIPIATKGKCIPGVTLETSPAEGGMFCLKDSDCGLRGTGTCCLTDFGFGFCSPED